MKLIDQSTEYWGPCPSDFEAMVERIERAGRTCFTPETEILTEGGWKPIESINPNERVLTYNQKLNILEYQISNTFGKDYNGDLIVINHRLCKLHVTPEHRIFCRKYSKKKDTFSFISAETLENRDNKSGFELPRRFENAKLAKEVSTVFVDMPDKVYMSGRPLIERTVKGKQFEVTDDFLTVVGGYISDGHLLNDNRGICITKKRDSPLLNKLREALRNLGWSYREGKSAGRDHIVSLVVTGGSPVGDWFEFNCGRGSLNKKLPAFWRDLDNHRLEILWEALMLGDGDISKDGRSSYRSSSVKLIEQLSELTVLIGNNCTVCKAAQSKKALAWTKKPHYIIYISKRPNLTVFPQQVDRMPYKGKVFCTQTGNGVVCVRVGGRIIWTGNCYRSEPAGDPEKFINTKLLKPDPPHFSVLEHSNVVGYVWQPSYASLQWLSTTFKSRWITVEVDQNDDLFIYGNLRAWMEALNTKDMRHTMATIESSGLKILAPEQQPRDMQRVTVKLITDRAVLAEITRHRNDVGFSVQSQRYVDYNKEVCYIKPSWYETSGNEQARQALWTACFDNEFQYRRMRSYGLAPQDARVVLNNQTATEIVMTAYMTQWDWILKLRRPKAAYPQMRGLMDAVYSTFAEAGLV